MILQSSVRRERREGEMPMETVLLSTQVFFLQKTFIKQKSIKRLLPW